MDPNFEFDPMDDGETEALDREFKGAAEVDAARDVVPGVGEDELDLRLHW